VIHIVTDSTSDLTPQLLQEAGVEDTVHIVPLTVHFGDEEYRDGVDLSRERFYQMLTQREEMPRTSQPSPAAFADVYREISQPGDTILSLHISSKLSGTHQSAALASRQFEDREIEVVDTRSVSLGLGLIVLEAAKAAKEGRGKQEILAEVRRRIASIRILFVVDTLEYLHKNGRIGKAQALVGGLLNVKPLLALEDGIVAPVEKVRGKAKARERMLERLFEEVPPESLEMGAVLHAAASSEAREVLQRLQERYPGRRFYVEELGPTVGTHAGPGTLGVVAFGR
jgi:EDD domain protein, DegV family